MRSLHLFWCVPVAVLFGSAAPAAEPQPEESPAPALDAKQLGELRLENQRLRDLLSAAEARLSLLAEKVFSSRLVVRYEGDLDSDYRLERLELKLDGAVVFRQKFEKAPSVLTLLLFDGYLPPGPHTLELRLAARGPDAGGEGPLAQLAGAGMQVHLREKSVCRAVFEAELWGNASAELLREKEPEADWKVKIASSFTTREGK